MRNILCTLLFSIMSLGVSAQSFDFTGEIGYDSDYVWRGVSQGNQPAFSIGGTVVHNATGLYAGVWNSDVEFDDATSETDFYGGIILPVSDTINLNVGYIRYTYDGTVASFEELYVIADIGDLSLSYYQDIDTNDNYAEVGYNLWFIPVLDVTLVGGLYDSEETFGQLDVSYSFNDSWSLNGIIGQDVFEDQVADSFSVGILYTY
jgi:uncharacterized protein (TIGR02001 family)